MTVIWHDLECGGYVADLPLWRELARERGGPSTDVGAGTGRVALDLARNGHKVTALDRDAELLDELHRRTGALPVDTVVADARSFELDTRFPLCIMPMQTVQLLDRDGRASFLRCARRHLSAGGLLAAALSQPLDPYDVADGGPIPLPDMCEQDGIVYSSAPTAIRVDDAGYVLERRREAVRPGGEHAVELNSIRLDRVSADELEREGQAAGLEPLARRHVPATKDHVGSAVVILGAERTLRVCALYPDLMNIYADRGNLLLLERRCTWRGIGFELSAGELGDALDPDGADMFYIGGGQDRDQRLCAFDLAQVKRTAIHAAAARGAVILAVCGGYQLLGHSYELGGETLPGVGLVDLTTVRAPDEKGRLIGNVAIEVASHPLDPPAGDGAPRVLAGFENHGGRTWLGPGASALGRVLSGHGNNGADGQEGVVAGSIVGTYLHGPLLPKNAWFADRLIAVALGLDEPLAPLDDELEDAAHAQARRAAGV